MWFLWDWGSLQLSKVLLKNFQYWFCHIDHIHGAEIIETTILLIDIILSHLITKPEKNFLQQTFAKVICVVLVKQAIKSGVTEETVINCVISYTFDQIIKPPFHKCTSGLHNWL